MLGPPPPPQGEPSPGSLQFWGLGNRHYPPFADRGRVDQTRLERSMARSASQSSLATTLSAAREATLQQSPSVGLLPNSYYRDRQKVAAADLRSKAALPRLTVEQRSPPKPVAKRVKKPLVILPESVFSGEARNARREGQRNAGVADQWRERIAKQYANLDMGVNTAKAYERMDKNRDGKMDREEVLKALLMQNLNVSAADLDAVMRQADTNNDGIMSFDEFERGIMHMAPGGARPKYMMAGGVSVMYGEDRNPNKKGNFQATDQEVDEYVAALRAAVDNKYDMLRKAFESADEDRSGFLTFDELHGVIETFKLPIPMTHVHEVFYQVFDKDGDGKVSYAEFVDKLKQFE